MGKKGKRSRRKTVNAADRASMDDLQTKIDESIEKMRKKNNIRLYSQAVDELREGIQLIETKMLELSDTMLRTHSQIWFAETKLILYSNLMYIELSRCNFSAVIQIYKEHFERGNIDLNMINLSPAIPTLKLQYHEALLRQGKGSMDTFITLNKFRMTDLMKHDDNLQQTNLSRSAIETDLFRSTDILRMTKHFDAAIVIGKQLGELTGDRLSLATTYLEQYLAADKPLPKDFFLHIDHVLKKNKKDGLNAANAGSMFVFAQSTYLLHQLYDDKEELFKKAIGFIEEYLALLSVPFYCITCTQTVTKSEVQLVCSGCRVACYCSIDHQRMSWKKEAVKGMCIGHEVLCPVMKAYRKWRHAISNEKDGEDDKVSRLRRRFERECLYLLSVGLGLKDKCFQE